MKITLDAAPSGAGIAERVQNAAIAVRLHTGNFNFAAAKEDGADIRFVAADDKTPLKHHIERFDGINEIAIVWVQIPSLTPGTAESIWLYSGNAKAAKAEDAKGTYDPSHVLVLHFGEEQGAPRDATGYVNHAQQSSARLTPQGIIGGAAVFDGNARIDVPLTAGLKLGANGYTMSAWVKSTEAEQTATLFAHRDGERAVIVRLDGGRLAAALQGFGAAAEVRGPALPAGAWTHVAVTIGDTLALYVNGREAGSAAAKAGDLTGAITIGGDTKGMGFKGELDEVQLAGSVRSASWMQIAYAQGPDGKLIAYAKPDGAEAEGGGASYMGILLGAVTLDGWIVIGILAVMLIVSFAIMILKTFMVERTDRANQTFLERFRALSADVTALSTGGDAMSSSSLFRLYGVGVAELKRRFERQGQAAASASLSPQAIGAIRASMDASLVRETHKLNNQMVLLTIAISGGPFLGLLGTVVGVMITFAAIAAAGDVNVNSIAPGIAAALVATVAGLAVAIPALFGYNYLASRIRNITADMQVFADEFVARIAESYSN